MHVATIKRIMRCLQGKMEFGFLYQHGSANDLQLVGWTYFGYARDGDDRKSTLGNIFKIGSGELSWSSKKQSIVTLSTTEAKFIVASSCACQGVWLRNVLIKAYLYHLL